MKLFFGNIQRLNGLCFYLVLACAAGFFMNVPAVSASPPDAAMCKLLEDFHGHTCAGSLMGLRLGLAARDALREQGKVEAKIFLQACPVDGAQVATGATCGNKTFTIEDRNDCRLILTHVKTGKQVEALLTPKAADNGQRFRALSGEAKNYTAGSPEHLENQKQKEAILDWFRTAPDAEVVIVRVLE